MAARVIWGEGDHENRARALASAYSTTAQSVGEKPSKVRDLETLVFWGHGDPAKFCGLTAEGFLALVAGWKKLNPRLRDIEMLTCNARHRQGGHSDSFTEQVVSKLRSRHAGLRFRALPMAVSRTEGACQFSILKWHPGTSTWAYIAATGQDDRWMWAAARHLEDFMPPRGDHAGYVRASAALEAFRARAIGDAFSIRRKLGQAEVDAYNASLRDMRAHSVILAGTLGMLRWTITDIR